MTGHSALQMFENRLKKLIREKAKWAKRENITCYRLYDKDIPQIPILIDVYDGRWNISLLTGSYEESESDKQQRENQIKEIISNVSGLESNKLYFKIREKKKGTSQYESFATKREPFWVQESGYYFQVDLLHSLDSGLFLDHRWARQEIQKKAKGKSFLNLFCYTGAFTVYAAGGGASSSRSLDLSSTYLQTAKENMEKNELDKPEHEFLKTDVLHYLESGVKSQIRKKYDLLFVDPPTFSNSKSMNRTWDIQRDHKNLLLLLLDYYTNEGGELYFSTNSRKFKLEIEEEELKSRNYQIEDLSEISIPSDFRDRKIHKLYRFFPML